MTYPRALCYFVVKVQPAIMPFNLKETWLFLRGQYVEILRGSMLPSMALWGSKKDEAYRFDHEHDAIAALLVLEDHVHEGTRMRVVREDDYPGNIRWPMST